MRDAGDVYGQADDDFIADWDLPPTNTQVEQWAAQEEQRRLAKLLMDDHIDQTGEHPIDDGTVSDAWMEEDAEC